MSDSGGGGSARSRNQDGRAAYEKRATRRAVRQLHQAVSDNDLDKVRELLTPDLDVDFHYNKQTALQVAVLHNHREACELLIQRGASVNEQDAEDNSLLNMAAVRGHAEVTALLINNGAELDARNHQGSTPLQSATYRGHTEVARLLIAAHADLDRPTSQGLTPLMSAALEDQPNIAGLLLDAGCDVNDTDHQKQTALILAAERGSQGVTEALLQKGGLVNQRKQYGETALYKAVIGGYPGIVRALISAGADVNLADTKRRTPVFVAVEGQKLDCVTELLAAKCDVNIAERDNLYTPIHAAVRLASQSFDPDSTHTQLVEMLLTADCDVNTQDKTGWTPLHQSTFGGDIEVTRALLDKKPQVDLQAKSGDVPLHGAMFANKPEIIDMLLQAGCSVDIANQRNETPLYNAITLRNSIDTIRKLVSAGSSLNVQESEDGRSPLHAAVHLKSLGVAEVLVQAGCDINLFDRSGTTPLGLASSSGGEGIVRLLLATPGVELDTGNKNIPLVAAARSGHVRIAEMLLEAGCDINAMTDICETAFQQAADRNHFDVALLLVRWGCDPSTPRHVTGLRRCCLTYPDPHPHLELDPLYSAVRNDNFKMIKLVILGTPRTNYRALKDLEDLVFRTNYALEARLPRRTLMQYVQFFRTVQSQPRRLYDECRGVIRECVGMNPTQKLHQVALPSKVKAFLLLEEELIKLA